MRPSSFPTPLASSPEAPPWPTTSKDNADLQFYVDKWIDWDALVNQVEFGFRLKDGFTNTDEAVEFYTDILDMVGAYVADEVAPHAAAIDHQKAVLVDGEVQYPKAHEKIFKGLADLQLHGMCLPRELGGLNVPLVVYMLNAEVFGRADVSMMTHHSFHGGMAMAMLVYSIREGSTEFDLDAMQIKSTRFDAEIRDIASGRTWGAMDITEPNAGSDMAALRTRAEQDEDGNWYVTGQKIFITSGDGRYHFVIARTEDSADPDDPMAGLGGLSFFLVPAWTDNPDGTRTRHVTIDRLEDKLGHNGSATCSVIFERSPAQLIGERGQGFRQMLLLMNNARVGVGFEALGLCEAAYRLAKEYAADRVSMGKTIDRHEMIADYLDEMAVDVAGIRAIGVHSAFHEEMAQRIDMELRFLHEEGSDSHRELAKKLKFHQWESRRMTPVLKYLASEKAVSMAQMAIQIHGGVGYTKEYGAEKLLRDAMVLPIYEGTSQIQSLMAMKDGLGRVMKNPQAFVREIAQNRWRSMSASDPLERRAAKIRGNFLAAQQHLIAKTASHKFRAVSDLPLAERPKAFMQDWDPKRDFAFAMLHAERLMLLNADALIAELFWAQASEHSERRELLEAFLERAEPRGRYLLDQITTTGSRLLSTLRVPTVVADAAE